METYILIAFETNYLVTMETHFLFAMKHNVWLLWINIFACYGNKLFGYYRNTYLVAMETHCLFAMGTHVLVGMETNFLP